MDDVFFQLGLLKADCKSYISLLPIPILELIKSYIGTPGTKKYIIYDRVLRDNIFTGEDRLFNDFFNIISNSLTKVFNYLQPREIVFINGLVNNKSPFGYGSAKYLMENKHLLYDALKENKRYCLKIRYVHEYETTYYKNDSNHKQSKTNG